MGCELVSEPAPSPSHTQIFESHLPFYLHIGMTPEQYWNGSADLTKAFREKHRMDIESRNQELWWQGAYIFHALSTALGNFGAALSGKKTPPRSYMKEPIRVTPLTKEEKARQAELEREKAIRYFSKLAAQFNKPKEAE